MTRRLTAAKRHKRWAIVDADTDEIVYVRPDFLLPVVDRSVLHALAEEMSVASDPIVPIMAHESAHNPRLRRTRRRDLARTETNDPPAAGPSR